MTKPTALKILHGEKNKGRINYNEPKPPNGPINPPDFLDPMGLKCWNEIVPILQAMRVLTIADVQAVATYCETFSHYRKITAQVRKEGFTVNGKRNPKLIDLHKFHDMCHKWLASFGMTPVARVKLTVAPPVAEEQKQKLFGA